MAQSLFDYYTEKLHLYSLISRNTVLFRIYLFVTQYDITLNMKHLIVSVSGNECALSQVNAKETD